MSPCLSEFDQIKQSTPLSRDTAVGTMADRLQFRDDGDYIGGAHSWQEGEIASLPGGRGCFFPEEAPAWQSGCHFQD
jgi:hypothetical protein